MCLFHKNAYDNKDTPDRPHSWSNDMTTRQIVALPRGLNVKVLHVVPHDNSAKFIEQQLLLKQYPTLDDPFAREF